MLLHRLLETSSFRLTLFYAAVCCGSFLVLFGVVYLSSAVFMNRQIDTTVAGEVAELRTAGAGHDLVRSTTIVAEFTARSPDFVYLLQAPGGEKLAGNFPPILPPVLGLHDRPQPDANGDDPSEVVRGQGVILDDGAYLFVGRSTRELHEMKGLIEHAFESSFAATILIALGGGALVSRGVLRRVESMSLASREIMAGDLRQRLAVRGSHDEFDHLAVSLNAMLDRMQSLMEGLRQISSDIAHELRTPLTRMRQRVELATRKATDADALRAALDSTLRDVDSVLETFTALLRIAQIEAAADRSAFASVDLTEALGTVAELYLPMAEEKGQSIIQDIAPGLIVDGNRELLIQLFANLVENAIRHTPAGASIEIRTILQPGSVDIVIADNGDGIPPKMRTRVFTRFVRLEKSRTTPGSGLGLSLAAAIAALHHSEIRLSDNAPGVRATVNLKREGSADKPTA